MAVTKTCVECGKEFTCRPSMAEKRRCCSRSCGSIVNMRERMAGGAWERPVKPRRGIETPCEACGKPVYMNQRMRALGHGRYCDRYCQAEGFRKEPVIKSCAYCGTELRLKPSQGAIQFCSKRCEADNKIVRPLGWTHNGRPARLDFNGYVLVWESEHPKRGFKGWHFEHRIVMEKALGRYLETDEQIHHINGDKADNRLENLQIVSPEEHSTITNRDIQAKMTELEEYRRRFGPLT